ncbi:hypothetical protein [Nocardia pneumoniae]|uniref:hypothetical protein n=1 Tax=Nocardia pneumoniae TaxID=228601 RepID=UPI0002FE57F8|nr:hypothetical protein [Nocardia pneumoniae]
MTGNHTTPPNNQPHETAATAGESVARGNKGAPTRPQLCIGEIRPGDTVADRADISREGHLVGIDPGHLEDVYLVEWADTGECEGMSLDDLTWPV